MKHMGRYMVINLAEKSYPTSYFCNRVMHVPFPDHQPAPLNVLLFIVESAASYLLENPQNVVAIHCKAGKGRTGMVIACLLIQLGFIKDIEKKKVDEMHKEALEYFGNARSSIGVGVQCPSQVRYVKYFCKLVKKEYIVSNSKKVKSGLCHSQNLPYVDKIVPEDHQIFIKRLIFQGLPDYNMDGGFQPTIIIFKAKGGTFKGDVLFNSAWKTQGACNSNAYFKANESKQQVSFKINISCCETCMCEYTIKTK